MISDPHIGIIDYGMGNLMSVSRAFGTLGYRVEITDSIPVLERSCGLVLPGVGAFKDCMRNLEERGLIEFIKEWLRSDRPYLGICLGLQLLFTESYEFGVHRGLDILRGKVVKFPEDMKETIKLPDDEMELPLKIPHMGWNKVNFAEGTSSFAGIQPGSFFYFVHSYYVVPEGDMNVFETEYGIEFVSGISEKNILAVQFHPEKSQKLGLKFLDNFGKKSLKQYRGRS